MRARSMILIAALLIMAMVTTAQASPFREYPWTVGVRSHVVYIPDFVLGSYYETHKSISAVGYGVFWGYSWERIELNMNIENYSTFWQDGTWMEKGGDPAVDRDYIEARGVGIASFDCTAYFKQPIGDYVEYRIGIGVGMGFPYGKVTTYDIVEDQREAKGETTALPSVLPVFALENVFAFYLHEHFSLNVNFGIKQGLAAGIQLQTHF
ncbi:MAG: hypothetical protein P9M14_02110 [Candidatus Alcyoniella australis]|nr:hypothetical protein [Candidatus Alcyoniella australis]